MSPRPRRPRARGRTRRPGAGRAWRPRPCRRRSTRSASARAAVSTTAPARSTAADAARSSSGIGDRLPSPRSPTAECVAMSGASATVTCGDVVGAVRRRRRRSPAGVVAGVAGRGRRRRRRCVVAGVVASCPIARRRVGRRCRRVRRVSTGRRAVVDRRPARSRCCLRRSCSRSAATGRPAGDLPALVEQLPQRRRARYSAPSTVKCTPSEMRICSTSPLSSGSDRASSRRRLVEKSWYVSMYTTSGANFAASCAHDAPELVRAVVERAGRRASAGRARTRCGGVRRRRTISIIAVDLLAVVDLPVGDAVAVRVVRVDDRRVVGADDEHDARRDRSLGHLLAARARASRGCLGPRVRSTPCSRSSRRPRRSRPRSGRARARTNPRASRRRSRAAAGRRGRARGAASFSAATRLGERDVARGSPRRPSAGGRRRVGVRRRAARATRCRRRATISTTRRDDRDDAPAMRGAREARASRLSSASVLVGHRESRSIGHRARSDGS